MKSREELRSLADRLRWIGNERTISLKLAQEICEKLPEIIKGLDAALAQSPLDIVLARKIAHKHCTCTCRDDLKVMQIHTNLCDEITNGISEYSAATLTSTDRCEGK